MRTYGLTHIALAVSDLDKSLRFYQAVFGVVEVYRNEGFLQVQTPDPWGRSPTCHKKALPAGRGPAPRYDDVSVACCALKSQEKGDSLTD